MSDWLIAALVLAGIALLFIGDPVSRDALLRSYRYRRGRR